VAESDETNNVKTDDYTVTPALADLVISGPLTLTPTTAAPGQQVSLNFNVTNQGTAASNAFRVGFYLSPDTTITAGDRLLFSFMHVSLVPGDSRNSGAAVTIPPSTAPGTYFIGPLADDQNAILESDETNNFKSTTLTVTGPDLVVSGWGVPPVTPTGGRIAGGFHCDQPGDSGLESLQHWLLPVFRHNDYERRPAPIWVLCVGRSPGSRRIRHHPRADSECSAQCGAGELLHRPPTG